MAVRALIPAERLNIAHVNSVDGSTDYESGVAYKAGCVVTYNGSTYVANIDIEDTDTDTPDEAPDKWGLCPNAKSLVEGGEVADLETRVTALEDAVNDLEDAVNDLESNANIKVVEVTATAEVDDTIIGACTRLMDALVTYCQTLPDGYVFEPILFNVPINANGSLLAFHGSDVLLTNAETGVLRIDASETRVTSGVLNVDIYSVRLGASGQSNSTMMHYSTSSGVTTSLTNTVLTDSATMLVHGLLYKKIV